MKRRPPTSPPATAADSPLNWPARAGAVDDVLREMETRVTARHRARRTARRLVVGAALVLLVTAGILSRPLFVQHVAEGGSTQVPSAIVSRPERRVLPDGSVVDLKPGAAISVAFSDTWRHVVLERGEAHFHVAKNPHRPFSVTAGEMEFRAVGTAFSVQHDSSAVELLVTEGRVAVVKPAPAPAPVAATAAPLPIAPPSHASPTLAVIDAGNRFVMPVGITAPQPPPQAMPVPPAQVSQRLAWRVPRLDLSGARLGDVLPLFNEYGGVRLELGDAELADVRLSGVLSADNIDTLLALLEDTYRVRVERRTGGGIVLRKKR